MTRRMMMMNDDDVQPFLKVLAQCSVNFVHQEAWDRYFKSSNVTKLCKAAVQCLPNLT